MSAQANFVRVRVPEPGSLTAEDAPLPWNSRVGGSESVIASTWQLAGAASVELLCTSRGLLKKMKQKVFVGDLVSLTNIDWTIGQGTPPPCPFPALSFSFLLSPGKGGLAEKLLCYVKMQERVGIGSTMRVPHTRNGIDCL
jgi:hypothetical protein